MSRYSSILSLVCLIQSATYIPHHGNEDRLLELETLPFLPPSLPLTIWPAGAVVKVISKPFVGWVPKYCEDYALYFGSCVLWLRHGWSFSILISPSVNMVS